MDIYQIIALIAGVASVLLIARQIVWGWPLGIINVLALAVIYRETKMYANVALQITFFALSIYGWWSWGRKKNESEKGSIQKVKIPQLILYFLLAVILTFPIWFFIMKYTGSKIDPLLIFFDAITTSFSIVAQYMLARKYLQNWLMWMCADIIYIPVCIFNGLYVVSIFYIIIFSISINAYFNWKRQLRQ
ncbi:MAG TPA: nicotinamide riboside transporter PnuC [Cytophagaceae bacterium]|nr:nicotinamide riboside transporter PnuC [Cytophagaceae bacterium]